VLAAKELEGVAQTIITRFREVEKYVNQFKYKVNKSFLKAFS
jgi:hypothetical protein